VTSSSDYSALIREDAPRATSDELEEIRDLARSARLAQDRVAELELELKATEREVARILRRDLPERMGKLGLTQISVAPLGNQPGFSVKAKLFYSASIGSTWEPQRRREAFDWLDANGHGSLIKTEVSATFPRESRDEAVRVAKFLELEGVDPVVRESVHSGTLTAWLKEMVRGGSTPPLEVIGGYVERRCVIEEEERLDGTEARGGDVAGGSRAD
jgi:hypothetical protein